MRPATCLEKATAEANAPVPGGFYASAADKIGILRAAGYRRSHGGTRGGERFERFEFAPMTTTTAWRVCDVFERGAHVWKVGELFEIDTRAERQLLAVDSWPLGPHWPLISPDDARTSPVPESRFGIGTRAKAKADALIACGFGLHRWTPETTKTQAQADYVCGLYTCRIYSGGDHYWATEVKTNADARLRDIDAQEWPPLPRRERPAAWQTADDVPVGRVLVRGHIKDTVSLVVSCWAKDGDLAIAFTGHGYATRAELIGCKAEWKPVDGGTWQPMEGTVL